MALVKKEVTTTQRPDGTIVTTTTRTRTMERSADHEYDDEFDFDTLAFYSCDYCCTPAAALRILQIVSY